MIGSKLFLVILFFIVRGATCLAAELGLDGLPKHPIISVHRHGRHPQTFSFVDDVSAGKSASKFSIISTLKKGNIYHIRRRLTSAVRTTFLPSGYPSRTPNGYLKYCFFSWIQDLSTQLRSVLATQRVLEGVGVGRQGATALSALMNYLVRDGCGMAATLIFTAASSSNFRTDVKRWRLFADIMVDLGISLEVLAVLGPQSFFLPMISIGNMCKAICGVAAGACGGAISLHWAKGSDISDISAKFGAQHTVTGACGLILAAIFARRVDRVDRRMLWAIYASLTAAHIWANMKCMRLIAFDSLNTHRMNVMLNTFCTLYPDNQIEGNVNGEELPDPASVAKKEPLFFFPWTRRDFDTFIPIDFGVSFNKLWESSPSTISTELESAKTLQSNYLIVLNADDKRRPRIAVSLLASVTPEQEAKAYFHAFLVGRRLQQFKKEWYDDPKGTVDPDLLELDKKWQMFKESASRQGWVLGKTELSSEGYEINLFQ